MVCVLFTIYMLISAKLGLELNWLDWGLLLVFSFMNFLSWGLEALGPVSSAKQVKASSFFNIK